MEENNNQFQTHQQSNIQLNNKKRRNMLIAGPLILLIALVGITYAFFNYTRTGSANTIRTGNIAFNTTQSNTLALTNAFPMSGADAQEANLASVEIRIEGATTYASGEEYEITITDVTNTIGSGANEKTIPISYIATYTPTDAGESNPTDIIGTLDNSTYYTARGGSTGLYTLNATGVASDGAQVLVGYIPAGSNNAIDGTLKISAYLDSSKIVISDTYYENAPVPSPTATPLAGPNDEYGTPASFGEGKTVLTTTEWNQLQVSPATLSFKIKAKSNEGIWVENPNTLYNKVKAMSIGTMNSATDFGTVASSDTTNHPYGVYQLVENGLSNPVYFYRGDHTVKNNVIFDNKCWLVVRTTESNSTRMIYNGTPVDGHCTTTTGNNTMISLYQSDNVNLDGNYEYSYTSTEGFTTLKTTFKYNVNYNNAKYVGYTYDNGVNSNMKNALEAWYEGTISSEAKAKIETSTYCNDTTDVSEIAISTYNLSNTTNTYFGGYLRARANTPSVICPTGTNAISSKVGFLTVDEEILAGRTWSSGMQDYLHNGNAGWFLGSPMSFDVGTANVFGVDTLYDSASRNSFIVSNSRGLRPVVSILSNVAVTGGDGSQGSPWIIG